MVNFLYLKKFRGKPGKCFVENFDKSSHFFSETRKKSCIFRKWELEKNNFSSKGNNVENIKTNKLFNEHNLPSSINKEN